MASDVFKRHLGLIADVDGWQSADMQRCRSQSWHLHVNTCNFCNDEAAVLWCVAYVDSATSP